MSDATKTDSPNENFAILVIFVTCLLVRALFILISGYDSFELASDTLRYDRQSNQILNGNYNLSEPLFITAPLYPYFVALFKLIFSSYWIPALQLAQLLIASLSGVFVFKIAKLIWDRFDVALMAGMIFCVYPFTFWWVHTFTQEMLFQSLFIVSVYFLIRAAFDLQLKDAVLFAVTFSLTFLTKSHIFIFAPFAAAFIIFSRPEDLRRRIVLVGVIAIICFAFTLPYGLYNLQVNGVYVFSSTGQGGFFLTGHNDDMYRAVVDPPPIGTPDADRLFSLDYVIFRDLAQQTNGLSHAEVQSLYFSEGLRWVRENPRKAATLAAYDLYYFLMPGLNPNWYSRSQWAASLIITAPLYLLAYVCMFWMLRRDFRRHFWILGLFISMILFSVLFYVQNRFRTITIEPFYIIYAAYPILFLLRVLLRRLHLEDRVREISG